MQQERHLGESEAFILYIQVKIAQRHIRRSSECSRP